MPCAKCSRLVTSRTVQAHTAGGKGHLSSLRRMRFQCGLSMASCLESCLESRVDCRLSARGSATSACTATRLHQSSSRFYSREAACACPNLIDEQMQVMFSNACYLHLPSARVWYLCRVVPTKTDRRPDVGLLVFPGTAGYSHRRGVSEDLIWTSSHAIPVYLKTRRHKHCRCG
jgi:hypothetical protein